MPLPGQSLRGRLPLLSPAFRHSNLRHQVTPRLHEARDPSSEGWNYGREYCPVNLAEMTTSTPFWGLLHAAKYDMGPTVLLPLRRKACWGFFRPKNPTASARFETANSGTPRPPMQLGGRYQILFWQKERGRDRPELSWDRIRCRYSIFGIADPLKLTFKLGTLHPPLLRPQISLNSQIPKAQLAVLFDFLQL